MSATNRMDTSSRVPRRVRAASCSAAATGAGPAPPRPAPLSSAASKSSGSSCGKASGLPQIPIGAASVPIG